MSRHTEPARGYVVGRWAGVRKQLRNALRMVDPLPTLGTLRGYGAAKFRGDLRAGLNGSLLALPQSVACAMIAGLPLDFVLVGCAAASIIGACFSRSRFVAFGPTNATAVLLLSALLASGIETEVGRAALIPLVTLMAGLLQILVAYLNVGAFVAYISRSVIVGYLSSAVVLIIANQIEAVAGIALPAASTFAGVIEGAVLRLETAQPSTLAVALATAALFLALRRFVPRWPNVALTLAGSVLFGFAARLLGEPVETLPVVDLLSWTVTPPALDFEQASRLASTALAVAFFGVLETSSVGRLLAARAGERFDSNQETYALGLANVGCSVLGGMPASGSPTRSMLNFAGGAVTPAASVMCGLGTLGLAFGLGSWMHLIPQASLAVVVVFAAASLLDFRQIRFVVSATPADRAVFLVTALAALALPLDVAILLGTVTSIVLYLRRAAEPELHEYAFTPQGELAVIAAGGRRPLQEIALMQVEGSFFFGAAELLRERIRRACQDPHLRIVVLQLKHAHHLDASAVLALEELVREMRSTGRRLIVAGAREETHRLCERTGLVGLIGREDFFVEPPYDPTASTRDALGRAQEILRQQATGAPVRRTDLDEPLD